MEDGWIVQPSLQCSKLHGREDELNIIHDAIERCLSSSGEALKVDAANTASVQNGKRPKMQRRKSFIFVDGVSGVGKSSLVEEDVLLRRFTTKQESNPPLCMYGYGKFEAKKIATPFAAIGKMLADIAAKLVHPINEGMKCHHSDYYVHRQILKSLNDKFDRFDKETLSNLDSRLGDIFSLGNQHLFDIDSEDGTTSTLSHSQSIRSTAGNGSGAFSVLSEASVGNDELLITMSTGLEELKNLLRIFIRTVAVTAPVVLVADDLQWMDEPSFQILKYIIEDHETVNLVFIGLYRPGQSLPEFTTEWMEGLSSDNNIDVTHIHLQTLSLSSIEELLSDAMSLEMEDVQKLAILVHDRTDGNPFYLTQLLESLQARGLLRYECNGSDFRWIWDEREIKESTMMVADEATMKIVVDRLRQLPERVQSCLHGAACIGSRFETRFLRTVMSATSAKGIEISSSFEQDLNVATQRKLVEETSQPGIHRFTHDQVYETALNLRAASPAERQDWHLKIGRALAKEFGVTDAVHDLELGKIEDSVLFVCTDQLNLGNELLLKSIEDSLSTKEYEEEAILLCQLNLEAGTRCATSMNAYTSSKEYLELGLRYIKKVHADPWEDNPNLMLEFHTALAEVYLCCGEPERVPSLVHETLLQTSKVPQLDTFRIRYAHLQALHTINNIDLLVDESLVLLDELGETFHKETTEKIVSNKRKAILKRLDALKDEDILCLGSLKDRRRIRAIQILVHVLSNVQYFSRYQGLTKVSQLRLLEMTLDYGICKFSAKGLVFASYALFDESKKILFDAFMRVANLAIKIAKKYGKTDWRNNITADGLVFRHWREPYAANVNDSLFQYENFLKHGNIDAAFHAVALYVYTYYFSGLDIRPLLKDMEAMCAVQWQYGARLRILHMLPLYQLVLNLVGQTNNVLDMYHGDAMYYRTILGWGGENGRDGEIAQWSYSLHLYVYCEEWEKATEMYTKLIDVDIGYLKSFPMWHCRIFFFALVAMHNARYSKGLKRVKYMLQVKKHMNHIRMWVVQRKAINLVHKLHLLEAVELTLRHRQYPSDEILMNAFNPVIVYASKAGFFQDAALAASLAAQTIQDSVRQLDYACLSQQGYKKWGATGVAKHLEETSQLHSQAAAQSEQILGGKFMGAWRGKERLRTLSTRILPELQM